jgi:formylglycine-generating enzyme required for sulfatase activity
MREWISEMAPHARTLPFIASLVWAAFAIAGNAPEPKRLEAAPVQVPAIAGVAQRAMTLAWIPAGTFTMGTPKTEAAHRANESPQTRVTLTHGFWMGTHEVTNGQWKALMGTDVVEQARKAQLDEFRFAMGAGTMVVRDYFKLAKTGDTMRLVGNTDDDVPIIWVSWEEAMDFCRKLTELARAQGKLPEGYVFRLPTEAEWEYAARAGTKTPFWWGKDVGSGRAQCDTCGSPTSKQIVATGSFRPNGFGLYDTAGNAAEWVEDCWNDSYRLAPKDAVAWTSGDCRLRVLRGGNFLSKATEVRSASRFRYDVDVRYYANGFRVVRDLQ